MRRGWAVGLMSLLLVAVGGLTWWRESRDACGQAVTSVPGSASRSPFLDAGERRRQPDADRDRLVATLSEDPAPIGEVVGAVGYHYEQWARVSAYALGLGVRTRDNPDFTMLDDRTLAPRWSVRVGTPRSTYDASRRTYLVATLPNDTAPDLVALDAGTGRRRWCATLDAAVGGDGSLATQILAGEDVAVLGPSGLARLSGQDGRRLWTADPRAGSGDFLGELDDDLLLAGGVEKPEILDPDAVGTSTAARSLAGVATASGRIAWTRDTPAGTLDRVVGTDPSLGVAVVEERTRSGGRLLGLDAAGTQTWSLTTGPDPVDSALRAGRLLVRSGLRWSAYDVRDGHRLWRLTVPTTPQFLPYGFELDGVPLLDADHALLGTTTALRVLDLSTGTMTAAPLPTDGISTTYWPYELAVTDHLVAVATNTGAVVVRRE